MGGVGVSSDSDLSTRHVVSSLRGMTTSVIVLTTTGFRGEESNGLASFFDKSLDKMASPVMTKVSKFRDRPPPPFLVEVGTACCLSCRVWMWAWTLFTVGEWSTLAEEDVA